MTRTSKWVIAILLPVALAAVAALPTVRAPIEARVLTRRLVTQARKPPGESNKTVQRLAEIGSPAVSPLIRLLSHKDERVRQDCCAALAGIGAPAAEPLQRCLADARPEVRVAAASSLAAMADQGIPTLLASLRSENRDERLAAARGIVAVDPMAHPLPAETASTLMSALAECLAMPDDSLRWGALNAVVRCHNHTEGRSAKLIRPLLRCALDRDENVASLAAENIESLCYGAPGWLHDPAKESVLDPVCVGALNRLARDSVGREQEMAVRMLIRVAQRAPQPIPIPGQAVDTAARLLGEMSDRPGWATHIVESEGEPYVFSTPELSLMPLAP